MQRGCHRWWFFTLLVVILVVACQKGIVVDLPTERLLSIEYLPLPDHWNQVRYGKADSPGDHILERWYSIWSPSDDPAQMIMLGVWADKAQSASMAKREYRRSLRRAKKYGCHLCNWKLEGFGTYLDQWTVLDCTPSAGSAQYIARYGNTVVGAELWAGDGVELDQAPELFAVIDAHVQEVIKEETQGRTHDR